jgi:hypothetical protein
MPNNNARVGSTFQTSGKYWQYASMVRLSNVKDTGEVCYNIVKTLVEMEAIFGPVISVRIDQRKELRCNKDGSKGDRTSIVYIRLLDNQKHLHLYQHFDNMVMDGDDFQDANIGESNRKRPVLQARLFDFTDEQMNEDRTIRQAVYTHEFVQTAIHAGQPWTASNRIARFTEGVRQTQDVTEEIQHLLLADTTEQQAQPTTTDQHQQPIIDQEVNPLAQHQLDVLC